MQWTAPGDGRMHMVVCPVLQYVSSAETGGAVKLEATTSQGPVQQVIVFAGGSGTGVGGSTNGELLTILVEPGQAISLQQTSALTGGAATVWAQLWAA